MRVQRYTASDCAAWNAFVQAAKNATFLLDRGYMDYHADRFVDHSLLFMEDTRVVAVIPANVDGDVFNSHGGLTYGGVIVDDRMSAGTMLELFDVLLTYLREQRITRLVYRRSPHIYHDQPSEEDLYALFRHGAVVTRRDVSSTIAMRDRLRLTKGRRWSARRAAALDIDVKPSLDYPAFMDIASDQLFRKRGIRPTHTGDELFRLAAALPAHIKLFGAYRNRQLLGGVVMYDSRQVAHVQYMTATDEGRQLAVLDRVLDVLLNDIYTSVPYFDFGISTEDGGRYFNAGLAAYKESFGARTVAYDTYALDIA